MSLTRRAVVPEAQTVRNTEVNGVRPFHSCVAKQQVFCAFLRLVLWPSFDFASRIVVRYSGTNVSRPAVCRPLSLASCGKDWCRKEMH